MEPSNLLLPLELVYFIVELSSGSPSSLAALARTHSSYQRKAEKALYDTLCICVSSEDSLKCMETLASNPEKAALVRFLTIEYINNSESESESRDRERVGRATTYLSKSLINMHSLSDFRLRSRLFNLGNAWMKGLSKILCEDYFRLQTFYSSHVDLEFLDISQIIKSQTELQILGICSSRIPITILNTLKELHSAQLFPPIVLIFDANAICIFPAFCSVDRYATIPQVLAQSFCKDQGNFVAKLQAQNIRGLSIYLTDSSDMPSIRALAKDMAASFPQIRWLNLRFERRCEIEIKKEDFSFFSNLLDVYTYVWPGL